MRVIQENTKEVKEQEIKNWKREKICSGDSENSGCGAKLEITLEDVSGNHQFTCPLCDAKTFIQEGVSSNVSNFLASQHNQKRFNLDNSKRENNKKLLNATQEARKMVQKKNPGKKVSPMEVAKKARIILDSKTKTPGIKKMKSKKVSKKK